jgi:hypothetical protein
MCPLYEAPYPGTRPTTTQTRGSKLHQEADFLDVPISQHRPIHSHPFARLVVTLFCIFHGNVFDGRLCLSGSAEPCFLRWVSASRTACGSLSCQLDHYSDNSWGYCSSLRPLGMYLARGNTVHLQHPLRSLRSRVSWSLDRLRIRYEIIFPKPEYRFSHLPFVRRKRGGQRCCRPDQRKTAVNGTMARKTGVRICLWLNDRVHRRMCVPGRCWSATAFIVNVQDRVSSLVPATFRTLVQRFWLVCIERLERECIALSSAWSTAHVVERPRSAATQWKIGKAIIQGTDG